MANDTQGSSSSQSATQPAQGTSHFQQNRDQRTAQQAERERQAGERSGRLRSDVYGSNVGNYTPNYEAEPPYGQDDYGNEQSYMTGASSYGHGEYGQGEHSQYGQGQYGHGQYGQGQYGQGHFQSYDQPYEAAHGYDQYGTHELKEKCEKILRKGTVNMQRIHQLVHTREKIARYVMQMHGRMNEQQKEKACRDLKQIDRQIYELLCYRNY